MRVVAILLIVATAACGEPSAPVTPSPLWGNLAAGPHAIGFRVVDLEDVARARHLRLGVWYPAHASGRPPVTVATYLNLLKTLDIEETLDEATPDLRFLALQLNSAASHQFEEAGLASLARTEMAGRIDDEAAPGRYPLLLWGLRHSTLLAQSVLSEYLASHGYRVAAVQPLELRPRYPWLEQPRDELERTIKLWVDDLRTALRHLAPGKAASSPQIGLLSWSYGGVSAALMAAQDRRAQVLVSLDSTGFWTVDQLEARADWIPAQMTATLLEMRVPREDSRSLFDATRQNLAWRLTWPGLGHGNFNAIEGFIPELAGLEPRVSWSVGGDPARHGYESIARLVRKFLDGQLKNADTWPPAVEAAFQLEVRTPEPAPPEEEDRVRAVLGGSRDYDSGWATDVAHRLIDEARWDEALELLRRNAAHHPASASAQFEYGAGLLKAGRVEDARIALEKTLQLSIRHPEATRLLRSLQ